MAEPTFSTTTERDGATATVRPAGELDIASAPALTAAVDAAVAGGARHVVVDLAAITFLDSTGIRGIVDLHHRSSRDGFELSLRQGPPQVRRVFELTGLAELLPFTA